MSKRDITEVPPIRAEKRVRYGKDPNQFFDVWSAANARATVVFIHGGFWRAKYDLTHASHLCAALAKRGFNVASLEYRRVGNSGGGWDGTFLDVIEGFASASRELKHPKQLVCGHSAGGHLALLLTASNAANLKGTLALAPVAVLHSAYELHLSNDAIVEFMGGTPQQRPLEYGTACPSKHAMKTRATIVHGTEDDVVPIRLSREFLEARKADGVRLLELAATGHMELIDPEDRVFETLCEELNRLSA